MSVRQMVSPQSLPDPMAPLRGTRQIDGPGAVEPIGLRRAVLAERLRQKGGAVSAASDEQTLVVRFEPLSTATGQFLVAAQVVGVRMLDLVRGLPEPASAQEANQSPFVGSKILVEIETPEDGQMRATVKLDSGALGPITLTLDFSRGHLELRATVCTERALQTLTAGEAILREGLSLAGLDLRGMQVSLAHKRAAVNPLRVRRSEREER